MKKFIFSYLVVSLAIIATAIFWFTKDSSCKYIFELPEGVNTSVACPVDGPMTFGFFIGSLIGAVAYVTTSLFILKKLGYKTSKK